MRRTKIVATLGPATDDIAVLSAILPGGVDVVRLNAAHSTETELAERLAVLRQTASIVPCEVGVLLDLPGPKVRIGDVADGVVLEHGHAFALLPGREVMGDAVRASVSHAGLADDVEPGARILIDDGRIELIVERVHAGEVHTRVNVGGPLVSHKGVNVPGVTLSIDAVTERDREIVRWALQHEIDWLGQSFVRSAADVESLRSLLGDKPIPIIAKIEKHEAAKHIDEIVATADGVMVARGDLGVETSPEQVPVLQRRIISAARSAGKPVIVATEMLDSMRERPRPTRAEASDVANAIFGRADAVMLSGETAVGAYPIESVETMTRIIITAEETLSQPRAPKASQSTRTLSAAVSAAASELASELNLAAIVPLSQSGATAISVARYRPPTPIIALVPSKRVARKLALVWGVRTIVMPLPADTGELLDQAARAVRESDFAEAGDLVAITAGLGSTTPGGTDFVHVRTL